MSDTSQGEGWWRASDGKWYAPETHPDYQPPAPPAPQPEPAPPAPPVPPIAATPPAEPNNRATIAAPIPQVPPAPAAEPPPAVPPIAPDVPAGATIVSPAAPVGGAPPAGGSVLPPSAAPIPPAPGGAASGPVANQVPMFVTIGGAVLLFVGLLLPWASRDAFGQSSSVSGLDTDDGKLMLVLAIALIGVTVAYMRTSATWAAILSILVALAALGLTLFEISDVSGSFEGISVGSGLWVDLIGSVLAVAGSIWAKIDSSN